MLRDAVSRNLKSILFEAKDFAWGTSSRSTKLVHGGVRYLENLEFGLVAESTRERARLWNLAPTLVKPLRFLFPAYKYSRVPLWKLRIGLWLYDLLSLFRSPGLHKTLSPAKLKTAEPALGQDELVGAIAYWDGATDDSLLTLANIQDARSMGAQAMSRCRVSKITLGGPTTPHTVHIEDMETKNVYVVQTKSFCMATGPWTDQSLSDCLGIRDSRLMATTRGSHIVVNQKTLPLNNAVVLFHPEDGRVLFGIPWGESTVVGTTDIYDQESPDKVRISSAEIDYLIKAAAFYFPQHPITRKDITSAWSGLRPLLAPQKNAKASDVSRDHFLKWAPEGFFILTGGKLTTHREMAEQGVDLLLEETSRWAQPIADYVPTGTRNRPLPPITIPGDLHNPRLGQSEATAISFETMKEILLTQDVMHLEDFLVRRTEIFYKEPNNGLDLLEKLRPVFVATLGWSDAKWLEECQAYRGYVNYNFLDSLNNI